MKTPHSLSRLAGVLLALSALLGPAQAAVTTGTFSDDDERLNWNVHLIDSTFLYAGTSGWAGGGFAPVLSLFDGAGLLLALDVGSAHTCVDPGAGPPDAATGFCWDARLNIALNAGDYTVVLSQDANLPLGPTLSDGFAQTGRPDYTGVDYLGQPGLRFINVDGRPRSGAYVLEVAVENGNVVPEPAAPALVALALGLSALVQVRRGHTAVRGPVANDPAATRTRPWNT